MLVYEETNEWSFSVVKEIEANIKRQEEELRKAQAFKSPIVHSSVNRPTTANPEEQQGFVHGTITNIIVILGFAAFAYTVKHILLSILDEWFSASIEMKRQHAQMKRPSDSVENQCTFVQLFVHKKTQWNVYY